MSEMSPQPQFQPDETAAETADGCPQTARLRRMIERLTEELANRQAEPRPLPSSVMRAYQALIDKYYAQISQLERSRSA